MSSELFLSPLWAQNARTAEATTTTLAAFGLYMVGVFVLALISHKLLSKREFVGEYFLGSRTLGVWALAFSFAATSASGGSFMGFPSLIYTHGWVLALWIASYMIVPIVTMGLLGKRLNQVARKTNAITIPDVLRDRHQSHGLGLLAMGIIAFFMVVNLVAQFKAGGTILDTLFRDVPGYNRAAEFLFLDMPGWLGLSSFRWWSNWVPGSNSGYLLALFLFALMVVAYTAYGGFKAVVWTEVMQGVVMGIGVIIMLPLALYAAGGLPAVSDSLARDMPTHLVPPGTPTRAQPDLEFLPFSLAISFFFMWAISGAGQPGTMVRLMAFKESKTLLRAIFTVMVYYSCIYLPLVVIFVAARHIPAVTNSIAAGKADAVMPTTALAVAPPWLAGLLIAAPFAAVMSTVDSFLLLISSNLVRDFYQRTINPDASERTMRWLSMGATATVGVIVTLAAMRPPQYLQYIIVFVGAGLASSFLAPTGLSIYWPRMTRTGTIASMLGGFVTMVTLYVLGWTGVAEQLAGTWLVPRVRAIDFAPLDLFGLDPVVWGLGSSLILGIVGSLLTARPPQDRVRFYFSARTS
jgi:sodium/pantothenate symporter